MNCLEIFDYYKTNRFFDSKNNYSYVVNNLQYFNKLLSEVLYSDLVDYSNLRKLLVKNATVNREISYARAAVNFYNRTNRLELYNPFSNFKLFESDTNVRYLTNAEAIKLLNASMQTGNHILFMYLQLLLLTGCRARELLTLTWDNVYLDNRFFIVRNCFSKSKKQIHKPICLDALSVFQQLKQHHPTYVFYNPKTNTHYKSFSKGFRLARDRAKLGKLRLHDLRHTYASWLVQKNVSLVKVQRILGHQDLTSTQRYAHFANNDLLQAADKITL